MMNSLSTQNTPSAQTLSVPKTATRQEIIPGQGLAMSLGLGSITLFIILLRLGIVLFSPATGSLMDSLVQPLGSTDSLTKMAGIYLAIVGGFAATAFLTIVLHEGLHGLACILVGYVPGFKFGKFEYTSAIYKGELTVNQFIFISLTPVFILSLMIMPLLLIPWLRLFTLIALAGNIAGSLDDIWLTYRMW